MARASFRSAFAIAVSAALAGVAAAQPVTRPEPASCQVTIALAPPEVRAEIEAWVRAEPRCVRELEIRVVPTDDGLYLSARDPAGRVRERVVPDGQSAAVLVVSWMADDSLGPDIGSHASAETAPEASPMAIATIPADDLRELPPGLFASTASAAPRDRRWLTLGALTSRGERGLRAQLDLFGTPRLRFGIAAGVRHDEQYGNDTNRGHARFVVGTTRTYGRLSLRAQLGLGAEVGAPDRDRMSDARDRGEHSVVLAGEAGVLATVKVSDAWGLVGGPVLEAFAQHEAMDLSFFVGVQRGL